MQIIIVTGLCGSGKTFFCQNKIHLAYDTIYSYSTNTLNYDKIATFMNINQNVNTIYLDGFNMDLINYLKTNYNIQNNDFSCILLYTSLIDYYNILAIDEPRDFGQITFDGYIKSIYHSIIDIQNTLKKLNFKIVYTFRNKCNYESFSNDEHLLKTITLSKKDILLDCVDKQSGDKNYQSILLDNEYIRKGAEQDWITFEKIIKCTSLKDKVICDTGCFNGYFSFKSLQECPKKIIGVDHNTPAINICNQIAIINNYHMFKNGIQTNNACEKGIHFFEKKIGRDCVFSNDIIADKIDVIFAFNYLHHLKNELGFDAFITTINSFFINSNEVIFEVNEPEIEHINNISNFNNFKLKNKIESHRKTSFGNRWILHYLKQ